MDTDFLLYMDGYLEIDLELFAKNLCKLFTFYLNENYNFQILETSLETIPERWPIWNQKKEVRKLGIISSKIYPSFFARKTLKPYIKYMGAPTLFELDPLNIDNPNFLLFFDLNEVSKISLGTIKNGIFIPNDFSTFSKEVFHSNPNYPFIEKFIKLIFEYKLINKKPIIDQNDMDIILLNFNISREELNQRLINDLKLLEKECHKKIEETSIKEILTLKR